MKNTDEHFGKNQKPEPEQNRRRFSRARKFHRAQKKPERGKSHENPTVPALFFLTQQLAQIGRFNPVLVGVGAVFAAHAPDERVVACSAAGMD